MDFHTLRYASQYDRLSTSYETNWVKRVQKDSFTVETTLEWRKTLQIFSSLGYWVYDIGA